VGIAWFVIIMGGGGEMHGLWFAWEVGWKKSLWWCVKQQMGDEV